MKKMVDVCDKCKKILSLDEMKNEIYLDYSLPLILCNDCFAKTKIKHKAEEMANAYQKINILSEEIRKEIESWDKEV